jgi:alanine racemase
LRVPDSLYAAWAEIDLDALRRNVDRLTRISAERPVRAVVKADAYGHGAIEVTRTLVDHGLSRFAVALVEEGIELRRAGIDAEILVLSPCRPGQCSSFLEYDLVATIASTEQLDMWVAATSGARRPLPIHVKVDTGMHRLGIAPVELPDALQVVRDSDGLDLAGLMSHLADADLKESPHTARQTARFAAACAELTDEERRTVELHLANSAGLLHHDVSERTAVRLGLSLYGYDPAGRREDLEPVMSVHSRIVQTHRLPPGERVGYGGRWEAERESRVGTVAVGYGDGYQWRLGGRAEALVASQRVPVIGAVSMDMLAVDITEVEATTGDQVVLLGRDGQESITAEELAERAGSLSYSVLCDFGLRLPRLYMQDGRVVARSSRHDRSSVPAGRAD